MKNVGAKLKMYIFLLMFGAKIQMCVKAVNGYLADSNDT